MRLIPCAYRLDGIDPDGKWHDLEIVEKVQRDGKSLWAVSRGKSCLNTFGEWEYEPFPSSRTDEFIARTRFTTPEDAADRARKAIEEYEAVNAGRR